MITETIVLDRFDNTWRSIILTGDYIVIADTSDDIKIRFGISSTSDGIEITPRDVLRAEETVYIKPSKRSTKRGSVKVYINKA